jgi:pimeloyl-ACP methyl ester carboxylesterase
MSGRLPQRVLDWRAGGEIEAVLDRRVFVRRQAGAGPLLLLLHGFPSSSYDWRGVLARLEGRAALALDFLGFGLSDKPRSFTYSLLRQADLVEQLVRDQREPVIVVAHDMGTSVATELLARELTAGLGFRIGAALLFNGGMIVERASLTWAQRGLRSPLGPLLARLSIRRVFVSQFAGLFSAAHPLTDEEAEDQWALWQHAGGATLAHRLIHYIDERQRFAGRWLGAFRDWPGRLELLWGLRDPVATVNVLAGLRELRPSVSVRELPELGHYPQIEDPATVAEAIAELAP